jgi:hypothetical protein
VYRASRAPFWASTIPFWVSTAIDGFFVLSLLSSWILTYVDPDPAFTLMRIRSQLPKIMRIRIRNHVSMGLGFTVFFDLFCGQSSLTLVHWL